MLLIYLVFDRLLESPPPQILVTERGREVLLTADRSGHFNGNGSINGVATTFLIDTGASYLSIPQSISHRLKLGQYRKPSNRVTLQTAAGAIQAYRTTVDSVQFEGIEQRHAAAVVVPGLEQALLGMNFLRRVEMNQKGKTMTLRVY